MRRSITTLVVSANLAMIADQAGPLAGDKASTFLCLCVAATTPFWGWEAEVEAANATEIPGQKLYTVPTLKAHTDMTMRTQWDLWPFLSD